MIHSCTHKWKENKADEGGVITQPRDLCPFKSVLNIEA